MSTVFQRHIRDLSVTTISVFAFADLSIVIFFPLLPRKQATRKSVLSGADTFVVLAELQWRGRQP